MVSIKCCSIIDAYVDADNGSDDSKPQVTMILWRHSIYSSSTHICYSRVWENSGK